jgi:hypothetical protein
MKKQVLDLGDGGKLVLENRRRNVIEVTHSDGHSGGVCFEITAEQAITLGSAITVYGSSMLRGK